jgi:hypothetical protein
LFDINDAFKGTNADPSWVELFKRAVGNAVLFESSWHPDGDAELKRENWLADTRVRPFHHVVESLASPGAWGAMSEEAEDLIHLDFQDHSLDRAYQAQQAAEAGAEKLTDDEMHWLLDRISHNGVYDKNERAVVEFIRDNAQSSGAQIEALIAGLNGLPGAA